MNAKLNIERQSVTKYSLFPKVQHFERSTTSTAFFSISYSYVASHMFTLFMIVSINQNLLRLYKSFNWKKSVGKSTNLEYLFSVTVWPVSVTILAWWTRVPGWVCPKSCREQWVSGTSVWNWYYLCHSLVVHHEHLVW